MRLSRVVGLSPSLTVAGGATVTVTVGATAAGTRCRERWGPEPARPWTSRQCGGRWRGQRCGGDGGRGHAQRQAGRVPQGLRHGFADAGDRRIDAGQPSGPRRYARRVPREPEPLGPVAGETADPGGRSVPSFQQTVGCGRRRWRWPDARHDAVTTRCIRAWRSPASTTARTGMLEGLL